MDQEITGEQGSALVQKLIGICHSDLNDTDDADAFKPVTPSLLGELEKNDG